MKPIYTILRQVLFTITIITFLFLTFNGTAFAQDWNQYYDTPPNVASCTPGVLTQSQKDAVLAYVNYIRGINGLKPVTYDPNGDAASQAATLMMVANNTISHTPPSSWSCYTSLGNQAAGESNLFMQWFNSPSQAPGCTDAIINWMLDNSTPTLGHRLAIINPFLSKFSFGRCDGPPNVTSQYPYATSMSFLWMNYMDQYLGDWSQDFVAVPYQNYPPELFNKTWVLSFSAFYDKTGWNKNYNVDYTTTTIEMKDDNNQTVNVHDKHVDDNQAWGGVPNCLSWYADGLVNNKKYTVTLTNVNMNGTMKNYTYWFNLNTSTMAVPDAPELLIPANNAPNVSTSPQLQWNPAQRASTYRVIISKNQNFTSDIFLDSTGIINYSCNILSLAPNIKYYWKVEASNDGGPSPWSPTWSFTTSSMTPDVPIQVTPNTGDTVSLTPVLFWKKALLADSYNLQISNSVDFINKIVDETGITDTSYTVQSGLLTYKTSYFWRVQSKNSITTSDWSTKWSFTVANVAPDVPIQATPTVGEIVSLTPTLKWEKAMNTDSYNLQIATFTDFKDLTVNQTGLTDTSYTVNSGLLTYSTNYYWRVQSQNIVGTSDWSTKRRFKTQDSINVVVETVPDNNSTGIRNYPNPFNGRTNITFNIPKSGNVTLTVYNSIGLKVATLLDSRLDKGSYSVEFDGGFLAPGAYYLQLFSPAGIENGIMTIVR
jgi:uncharacterized protein YkwD